MNPDDFFNPNNNPNFEIGQGKRGLTSKEELNQWDPELVYVKCTSCDFLNMMNKMEWFANIPTACSNPICNRETLAHEYIVPNAFLKTLLHKNGVVSEVLIDEPFRQACIVRYVRIQSQI